MSHKRKLTRRQKQLLEKSGYINEICNVYYLSENKCNIYFVDDENKITLNKETRELSYELL